MITLSRLNGQIVAINPDLITWIDVTPDTTVSLLGGDRIIVRESLDEVIERVIAFRRAVSEPSGHPPAADVVTHATGRESGAFRPRTTSNPHEPTRR